MPSPFTAGANNGDTTQHINNLSATSGVTPLATTTLTAAFAAPTAANCRNFVTGIWCVNVAAAVLTNFSILDGSTVLWTCFLPAATAALVQVPAFFTFLTPLKCSVGNATNVQCGTTAASVYWNLQGYSGPY